METSAPAKQRSPWFYVLLGCGGFAAVSCLGVVGSALYCGKKVSDIGAGVMDPARAKSNATEMLGALPEGYHAVAGLNLFGLMEAAVLTDAPPAEDGGWRVDKRQFRFWRIKENDNTPALRAGFTNDDGALKALRNVDNSLDLERVLKRGELTAGPGTVKYFVGVGSFGGDGAADVPGTGMMTGFLFDCGPGALNFALWLEAGTGEAGDAGVEFASTVGDEAEMARLLKPVNPCRKR